MKKTIYTLAMLVFLYGGLTSCKSNAEKQEDAVEDVQEAQQDLNEAQADAQTDAADAEANKAQWEAFKQDVNATIAKNEQRLEELRADIKKQGNKADASYQAKVDDLKAKNDDLKVKMEIYENDKKQDWESFKTEFNADMSDLGESLKNFTINNKK